jgi:ankyrin repeat protein
MYNSFALSRKKDIAMKNNQNMLLASVLILIGCNNLIGAVERSQDSMDNLSKQLLNAANVADLGSVRRLLVAKADMEAVNKNGETPLLCVAWRGHADVVRELVTAKANIEAADRFGYTPLIYAAACGKLDVVRELLTARANMEAVNKNGETPLLCVAWRGHADVVRELFAAKANIEATDEKGYTPLHYAVVRGCLWSSTDLCGHLDVVSVFAARANLSTKNNDGETALDLANAKKHAGIVGLLRAQQKTREEKLEPALGYLVNGPLSVPPLCHIAKDYLF